MSKLTAGGLCVGILAGFWFWLSSTVPILVGVCGYFAYASFYAAGGGKKGLVNSFAANMSGIVWAIASVYLGGLLNGILGGEMAGTVIATTICSSFVVWQARFSLLGFVPGGFFGMTSYFASSNNLWGTVISMALGAVIGFVSEYAGNKLSDLTLKDADKVEA